MENRFEAEFVTRDFIDGKSNIADSMFIDLAGSISEEEAMKNFRNEARRTDMVLRKVSKIVYFRPRKGRK
jgi:hypothetical protein